MRVVHVEDGAISRSLVSFSLGLKVWQRLWGFFFVLCFLTSTAGQVEELPAETSVGFCVRAAREGEVSAS